MRTHTESYSFLHRAGVIVLAFALFERSGLGVGDPSLAALDKAVAESVSDFHSDAALLSRASHDLASIPEWREPLWGRFTKGYFEGDPQNFRARDSVGANWIQYLDILADRNDLSEAQVKRVTDEMRRIYARPYTDLMGETYFIEAGIKMLKHYPSKEHEDLCLAAFDWGPTNVLDWLLCRVSDTLAEIGSEAALKKLKATADKVNGQFPGGKAARSVEFEPNIQALESRLSAKRARTKLLNPWVATGQTTGGSGRGNAPGEEKRGELGTKPPSFVWEIVAVVIGAVGLIALLRSGTGKR